MSRSPDKNSSTFPNDDSRSVLDLWNRLRTNQQPQQLLGLNKYVLGLLGMLEDTQRELQKTSNVNAQFKEMNERLQRENKAYDQELEASRKENTRLNSELASVQTSNEAMQEELLSYKQLVNAAKAEIQSASFALSPAPNEDTPENRSRKRRSSSMGVLPDKRAKRREVNFEELCEEEEENEQEQQQPPRQPLIQQQTPRQRSTMRQRSMSESRVFEDKKDQQQKPQQCLSTKGATSTIDLLHSPMIGFASGSWTRGRPIEQCDHTFVPSNKLFTAAFSYCNVCTRGLGYRTIKCNDCKLQIHENCRQNAPTPCVPITKTPQSAKTNPRQRPKLPDLCPENPPFIPGDIIQCTVALERGQNINTLGLYRMTGCDSEVKKLKDNFTSKYVPRLDLQAPEIIAAYINNLLRGLREPLIPFSSFKEFHQAVVTKDVDQLKSAIETLPLPNRDTLAFLCAHWQRVARHSNENQMSLESLAKVLGPAVVGTALKLAHLAGDPSRASVEAAKPVEILLALLKLDHDYWTAFYNQPAALVPQGSSSSITPNRGWGLRRQATMREATTPRLN